MEKQKIWHKSIQNPYETPWANWIKNGMKKYEGRLCKDEWANMKIGDTIIFNNNFEIEITELIFFTDFSEAYRTLGKNLVPGKYYYNGDIACPLQIDISEKEVSEMYSKYFSEKDIKEYGVVAVGVRLKTK